MEDIDSVELSISTNHSENRVDNSVEDNIEEQDTEIIEGDADLSSIDDNRNGLINTKPICLILLDLLYWLIPNIKVFGGTVRDILADQESHHLHILIDNISEGNLHKRLSRFISSLEIHGFSIHIEKDLINLSEQEFFAKNLIDLGVAQAIISRYGSNEKSVKILLIAPKRMHEYNAIFRCDMLYMTKGGNIHLRDSSHLHHSNLCSQKISLMREIFRDIENRRLVLIEPIQIKNGFRNRFNRSKIAYKLIRLQERGWKPDGFNLVDCGLNLKIDQLKIKKCKKLNFPDLQLIKNNKIYGEDDTNDQELCPICRESLAKKSTVLTSCQHQFHNRCLFQHFYKIGNQSSLCPICRHVLVREMPIDILDESEIELSDSELGIPEEDTESDEQSDEQSNEQSNGQPI